MVQDWSKSSQLGPARPNFGRFRSGFGRLHPEFGPTPPNVGRIRPKICRTPTPAALVDLGHIWPKSARRWWTSIDLGRTRLNEIGCQFWSNSVQGCATSAEVCRARPTFCGIDHFWSTAAQAWSKSAHSWSMLSNCGRHRLHIGRGLPQCWPKAVIGRHQPNFGRARSTFLAFHRLLGRVLPCVCLRHSSLATEILLRSPRGADAHLHVTPKLRRRSTGRSTPPRCRSASAARRTCTSATASWQAVMPAALRKSALWESCGC